MKARRLSMKIIFTLFLALLVAGSHAQEGQYTKKYHQSFSAGKNTRLTIDNKYGNVNISDWDNNTVEIDVVVLVDNITHEKAERILAYINVEIGQDGDEILARTVIDEKMGRVRSDNLKLEINYTVNMPSYVNLNLNNKYGSVFVTELTGHAVIDVKYGNLKAGKLLRGNIKPLSEINLAYSDADIEEAEWLKSTIKYAKLEIADCQALLVYSKYSKVLLDRVSSGVSESRYDEFRIGKIDNFVVNTEYSDLEITEVRDKLVCETQYTDCRVEKVPAGFESIEIDAKYGGYRLGIDPDASYKLKGYAAYAKISYPDTGEVSRTVESTSMKVEGFVGTDKNTLSTVTVNTKYGSVRLDD